MNYIKFKNPKPVAIIVLIAAIILIWFVILAPYVRLFVEDDKCDQETTATIVDCRKSMVFRKNSLAYLQFKCSYVVNGVEYTRYEISEHGKYGINVEGLLNKEVKIRYNSQNPKHFFIDYVALLDAYKVDR